MKLRKSLVLTLLAAGSLIMGSAQAQEKLFTAQMGTRLDNDASLYGEVHPLGNHKEIFGILIQSQQYGTIAAPNPNPTPTDLDGDGDLDYNYNPYKQERTLKLFSVAGVELKNLSSSLLPEADFDNPGFDIYPLGNGSFVLQVYGQPKDSRKKYLNDHIYFSRVGTDWVETSRFKVERRDKDGKLPEGAIQYGTIFEDGIAPAGILAFFKTEGTSAFVDVYASNKAALTPAPEPQITSDLATLNLKTDKAMRPYATTANFPTTGFLAFGLPPGLKINPATGQISGKPTAKGSFSVVIGALRSGDGPILVTKGIRVK